MGRLSTNEARRSEHSRRLLNEAAGLRRRASQLNRLAHSHRIAAGCAPADRWTQKRGCYRPEPDVRRAMARMFGGDSPRRVAPPTSAEIRSATRRAVLSAQRRVDAQNPPVVPLPIAAPPRNRSQSRSPDDYVGGYEPSPPRRSPSSSESSRSLSSESSRSLSSSPRQRSATPPQQPMPMLDEDDDEMLLPDNPLDLWRVPSPPPPRGDLKSKSRSRSRSPPAAVVRRRASKGAKKNVADAEAAAAAERLRPAAGKRRRVSKKRYSPGSW